MLTMSAAINQAENILLMTYQINNSKNIYFPPEADKGLIPRRLRSCNAFLDTPLLCSGVVYCRSGEAAYK